MLKNNQHPAAQYGTDKQFLNWLSYQPSCLDGTYSQYYQGEGRNVACHVRRAGEAGTAIKPVFSAVPMTDAQHKLQSQKGERAVLAKYFLDNFTVEQAKDWFDKQVQIHVERWIKQKQNPRAAGLI